MSRAMQLIERAFAAPAAPPKPTIAPKPKPRTTEPTPGPKPKPGNKPWHAPRIDPAPAKAKRQDD